MYKEKRKGKTFSFLNRLAALALAAVITVAAIIPLTEVPAEAQLNIKTTWGVFIGVNLHGNTYKVRNYKKIVIDAQHYTAAEIKKLKSGGRKVYSYLSIGSIATYRSYYSRFKKYTLGNYHNWPSERWIDTSKKAWQDFVVNNLGTSLKKKGVDGLWVDNTDVWYEYHRKGIFDGMLNMLRKLKAKGFAIIINGGDVFVSHLIKCGKSQCINGVMQEEVLTQIVGYNSNKFARQGKADRTYYENYLKLVKKAGKSIALLEYTKNMTMAKNIIKYCLHRGYTCYISDNVALK